MCVLCVGVGVFMFAFRVSLGGAAIGQQSPTFLAAGPSFVEDKFSIDMVGGMISG